MDSRQASFGEQSDVIGATRSRDRSNQPSTSTTPTPSFEDGDETLRPGDEAPEGTPGTGENVCPLCNGSGRNDGVACPECDGTGKVTTAIGGG